MPFSAAPSTSAPFVAVAGLSARMLAQSAAHAGYQVAALDLFGDRDTRRYAKLWLDTGGSGLSIDRDKLQAALERVVRLPKLIGYVVGSGIEPHIDWLQQTARLPRLIGNDADATAAVRDPRRFFPLLDELRITHPEVAFERPERPEGWLHKAADGCGGTHICPADSADTLDGYFQRVNEGLPMSALFLAARREAFVVGYAEQLCVTSGTLPYLHAGSLGPVDLPAGIARQIDDAVRSIAARANLSGLNSLDFLLDGDAIRVLEVNARPSSTMALYERAWRDAWPRGLLAAHIDACHGRLPPERAGAPQCRVAQQVVFAPAAFTVTRRFSDALFVDPVCHDIPNAGTRIEAGQPVCTVLVTGRMSGGRTALQRELQHQTQRLLQRIETSPEPCHELVDSHG
ncbi:Predicted ATP-dependent carboligase, ATP-grasp superfamily [Burkholderia sp. YR290]|jgi:predicted ATP-grasp superfamily ATP-dependent carboligase|uniref:ATP-grasp domain-containing protein n=1 Tax=Paraburkholderia hospita TaxID=169430 RepID=UPI0009A91569|nr:ATP-grasp domain-containing protein [Paraburkholderia hospita]SKD01439.1 Predicted ATP-dependent carboligase, ATP-grasp superfamily [Paraburkholderia hospita]SOE83964.1 Predicted ATP-dependent carboligase, ATP-grasp superfamily [Burkholderia sp. YR290]